VGLSVALGWLPIQGIGWHVASRAYYLPILLVAASHGSLAGLFAGLTASVLCVLVAATRGMGDMAWLSIFVPDFAIVGFLGGRFLDRWPQFKQLHFASRADVWPALGRSPEPKLSLNLNPLASIQSAAELLAIEETPAGVRQELVGIISMECERLSSSIIGLLEQTRGAAPPQTCEVDTTAIIDAAVREAEFVFCGRGIRLRKEIAPDLPPIQCNPDQIRSVLISLIANVLHSAPAGDEVVLNAHRGRGGVILNVRETGRGAFLHGLVRRFFGSRPEARGVGLAAAYEIVRLHDGTMDGKLTIAKGLEFSVWLPLRRTCTDGTCQGVSGGGR
jgi:hypothetical protein